MGIYLKDINLKGKTALITGISGTNDDSKSPIGLGCPKCKVFHPLINININEDSSIYMYGENCFRTREEDGLNIYPFLCFKCKQVTEYASDPNNQSGHAVCGFEYFESKKRIDLAEHYFDHFTANGWRQGSGTGKPIKDWKAAARNWIRNDKTFKDVIFRRASDHSHSLNWDHNKSPCSIAE